MQLKKIITKPQVCDMGSGFGEYKWDGDCTLGDVLKQLEKDLQDWGTITIKLYNEDIIRIFDYDLDNHKQFYHHLCGWEYNKKVKKIFFGYCFMNQDITIILER